jgi:hypothetical protein
VKEVETDLETLKQRLEKADTLTKKLHALMFICDYLKLKEERAKLYELVTISFSLRSAKIEGDKVKIKWFPIIWDFDTFYGPKGVNYYSWYIWVWFKGLPDFHCENEEDKKRLMKKSEWQQFFIITEGKWDSIWLTKKGYEELKKAFLAYAVPIYQSIYAKVEEVMKKQ